MSVTIIQFRTNTKYIIEHYYRLDLLQDQPLDSLRIM
jgi:hypothetical protein